MKKIVFCLISVLAMVGCHPSFQTISYQEQQKQDFNYRFERRFGTPASDQD